MGYSHYLEMKSGADADTANVSKWSQLVDDAKRISAYMAENEMMDGRVRVLNDNTIVVDDEDEDCFCEPLYIEREFLTSSGFDGSIFCKTRRMPYDTVVLAMLFAIKKHYPRCVLGSDANTYDDLKYAVEFFGDVFGDDARKFATQCAADILCRED